MNNTDIDLAVTGEAGEALIGEAIDAWINVLIRLEDNPYDLCECGCQKKWKYCREDVEAHQDAFLKNFTREGDR